MSEGHGFVTKSNEYGAIPKDKIWHQLVLQDLRKQFGSDQVTFANGSKAATDSGYFEWCYRKFPSCLSGVRVQRLTGALSCTAVHM